MTTHQRVRRRRFDGRRLGERPFVSSARVPADAPVLFVSDLHFGDGSRSDLFADQDQALVEFVEHHRRDVELIVFLGDILDMPQAWRAARIAAAHPELFAYLRDLARRQPVVFASGNHDWSVDYEALFPGARCREVVRIGDRLLAWHGHQVDLLMSPGARDATFKTYVHSLLERLAGSRLVPPVERFDSRANRLATHIAVSWSRVALGRAGLWRAAGRPHRAAAIEDRVRYLARSVLGDPADIFGATGRLVLGGRFDAVICGHTHVPGVIETGRGTYANTGTWTGGMRTAALWTGERVRVLDARSGSDIGAEHLAAIPERTEPRDLFAWWWATRRSLRRCR